VSVSLYGVLKPRSYVAILSMLLILSVAKYTVGHSRISYPAISLSQIPRWSLKSEPAAGFARQIKVLKGIQNAMSAPPGATVNLLSQFDVSSPVADKYQLVVSLVDSHGNIVTETRNNLDNKHLVLPTNIWLGPVSFITTMTLPQVPDGLYSITVGLDNVLGPIALSAANGVTQEPGWRYKTATISISSGAPAPSLLAAPTLDLTDYTPTLDEEFPSLSISDSRINDGSRWYSQVEQCCMSTSDGARARMAAIGDHSGTFELLPGGGLNIRLQKTSGDEWTSGVLSSVDASGKGFSQEYGYFEMQAEFPPGIDTWPAFWLLSTAARSKGAPAGEIDIVEYVSNPGFANYISTTLHDWSKAGQSQRLPESHHRVPLPTAGLHTYGMLWTPSTLTFYFDGSITFQAPTPDIMHQEYYLLVDLGIGAGWPTASTPAENNMRIRYIRAYKHIATRPS
jgi:hypothetical protein